MTVQYHINMNSLLRTVRTTVMATVILLTLVPVAAFAQQDFSVEAGGTATFTFTDFPAGAVTSNFQWQVSTDGGTTWNNVSGSNYSGITTSTLTISNTPIDFDGYQYRFTYTMTPGSTPTPSSSATLYVYVVPKIISHPVNSNIPEGSNTSFSVVTAQGDFVYQYQWQYRSRGGGFTFSDVSDGGIYSGATTAILTLTNVPRDYDGYEYRCRVMVRSWNNWLDYSNFATLTVRVVGTPPVITTNTLPEGTRGTSYSVTLTATGTAPIVWGIVTGSLPDGLALNANTGLISGTPSTSGPLNFTVRATNDYGVDTKEFNITVNNPPPQIVFEVTSPATPFCTVNDSLSIPFRIIENTHPMKYRIRFSDEAKAAGFKDITSFDDLPADLLLKIEIPQDVPSKLYAGVIIVECEELDNYKDEYPFTFTVVNNGIVIVNQLPAFQSICGGTAIALVVDISGNARNYQWYKNGQAIVGAKDREYMAETEGSYYVEIMGECGMIRSEVAVIAPPSSVLAGVSIRVKWGNVLYVENASDKYERYQWYHNGTAINGATFIYLSEREGFLGEYSVRCYKLDGSFDETCPIVFNSSTRSSAAAVYPTIVKTNDVLNINITDAGFDAEATVEIYSLLGVQIYSAKIMTPGATIRPNFRHTGNYFVKIKMSSGEVLTEKIIVQ